MPKFELSAHAKTVITERSIELEWLERVPEASLKEMKFEVA